MRWQDPEPENPREDERWLELVCRNCGEVMWTMRHESDERERWRVCRLCFAQWEQWPDGTVRPARPLTSFCAILTVFCSWGDWHRERYSMSALFGAAFSAGDADA